jgi:hypothetical protein
VFFVFSSGAKQKVATRLSPGTTHLRFDGKTRRDVTKMAISPRRYVLDYSLSRAFAPENYADDGANRLLMLHTVKY